MRRYHDGARLLSHVDREATHALSLIINVDQVGMRFICRCYFSCTLLYFYFIIKFQKPMALGNLWFGWSFTWSLHGTRGNCLLRKRPLFAWKTAIDGRRVFREPLLTLPPYRWSRVVLQKKSPRFRLFVAFVNSFWAFFCDHSEWIDAPLPLLEIGNCENVHGKAVCGNASCFENIVVSALIN